MSRLAKKIPEHSVLPISLTKLDLSKNEIKHIFKSKFKGIRNHKTVGMFSMLKNLTELNLSGNSI